MRWFWLMVVMAACIMQAGTPSYRTMYRDDFPAHDAHRYNTCYRWESPLDCEGANGEMEAYLPSQVVIDNGLHLIASATPYRTPKGKVYTYRSGMITTDSRFSFLYGTITVRVRLPRGRGLWPAIWLLAQDHQPGVELDVLEFLGNAPHTIFQGVHYVDAGGRHRHDGGGYTGPDYTQGEHTVQVEWRPDAIIWWVDGVMTRICTDPREIPHTPLFVIANLAVGGIWPGPPDAATPFPADFTIISLTVQQ
jgi:beta-glucanase (GH16 family)